MYIEGSIECKWCKCEIKWYHYDSKNINTDKVIPVYTLPRNRRWANIVEKIDKNTMKMKCKCKKCETVNIFTYTHYKENEKNNS